MCIFTYICLICNMNVYTLIRLKNNERSCLNEIIWYDMFVHFSVICYFSSCLKCDVQMCVYLSFYLNINLYLYVYLYVSLYLSMHASG